MRANRPNEAHARLQKLNTKDRFSWDRKALHLLTNIYIRSGSYSEALQCVERYLEISPDGTEFLDIGARAAFRCKNYQKALELNDRYLLRRPHDTRNMLLMCNIHRNLNDHKNARRLAMNILRINPQHVRATEILHEMN